MKKLLAKSLLLLPIPVLMAFTSFLGDPAHLFNNGRYERKVASILLDDKNAGGISNYDERLVQRFYAEGSTNPADTIVIGSSRSMQIHEKMFPGRNLFNCCVSGATLNDYLGIYQMYRSRGHLPSTIIVGLDPWILNHNDDQLRWLSIKKEVLSLYKDMNMEASVPDAGTGNIKEYRKYLELVSLDYFRQSLKSLFDGKSDGIYPTMAMEGEVDIKLSDGSLRYNRKYRSRSEREVDAVATATARTEPVYSLGQFHELDPSRKKIFNEFLTLLQKDNVKIIFYLAPYHPKTYEMIVDSGKYPMVPKAEQYFRSVASQKNIPVYGSYDFRRLNINRVDFYDGLHPAIETIEMTFDDSVAAYSGGMKN